MKSEAQEWQKLTKLYQVGYYELLKVAFFTWRHLKAGRLSEAIQTLDEYFSKHDLDPASEPYEPQR